MQYKAGDSIKVISKERLEKHPEYRTEPHNFTYSMDPLLGTVQVIDEVIDYGYRLKYVGWLLTDETIEGLAGPMDSDTIQKDKDKKKLHGELQKYIVSFNLNEIHDLPKEFYVWSLEAKADWLRNHGPTTAGSEKHKPTINGAELAAQEGRIVFVLQVLAEQKTVCIRYPDYSGGQIPYSHLHDLIKRGTVINWDQMDPEKIPSEFLGYEAVKINRDEIARMEQLSEKKETVNHPAHYGGDTPYEVVKVMEAWDMGYHLGNAIKYIYRAGKKDPSKTKEDLQKAMWYIQRKIAILPVLLCFCLAGFSQEVYKWDSTKSVFIRDSTIEFLYQPNNNYQIIYNLDHDKTYQIWDKAGPWFKWKEDSDTLQLIPPAKVHYIMIGKKIIRL